MKIATITVETPDGLSVTASTAEVWDGHPMRVKGDTAWAALRTLADQMEAVANERVAKNPNFVLARLREWFGPEGKRRNDRGHEQVQEIQKLLALADDEA